MTRPTSKPTAACRCLFLLAAITLPTGLHAQEESAPDAAEDNKQWACRANENEDGWICESGFPSDWIPTEQLPEELRTRRCLRCGGRYMDPLGGQTETTPPDLSDVNARARTTEMEGDLVRFSDGVELSQGSRSLKANSVTYDRVSGDTQVEGEVTLREPGVRVQGDRADLKPGAGETRVENAQFILHDFQLRGTAGELERDREDNFIIHDAAFTFCAPGEQDWAIEADNLDLDTEEGVGVARHTKIKVEDVPVFYLPYLSFPIDDRRRTGLLWPTIGSGSRGGLDVAIPAYFNLAPNYDATYTPRYIQQRGLNHEMEFRYLGEAIGMWSIGGAYMDEDDKFVDEHPDEERNDRWLRQVQHNNLIQQRWRSRVDYTEVSDPFYMKDLETTSIDTKRETSLQQQATLDYLGDRLLLNVEVQQFQSLADDIGEDYKKLPQITTQYRSSNQPFQLSPVLLAQYSNFDIDNERRVTGERVYAEAGARFPMQWEYGFLNSEVKYRQLSYRLNDSEEQDKLINSDPGAALAHVDGGLYFERETSLGGEPMIQTLEPRIAYLYSGYEDQRFNPDFDSSELTFNSNQLYRQTRFSGHDRIDDANQVSVGVTTRFIEGFSGEEILSAYVGQIYYFEDRRVRLQATDDPVTTNSSEYAAGVDWRPSDQFRVRSNVVYDHHSGKVNSANFNVRMRPDESDAKYNVGYSFRRALTGTFLRDTTDQVTLSTYQPIGPNWGLFAALSYSLEQHTSVEDMFGFEYDTCCWRVRLLHLRYFDSAKGVVIDFDDPNLAREESTQLQISLKGLGGFGGRVDSILEKMIRGYRRSEF